MRLISADWVIYGAARLLSCLALPGILPLLLPSLVLFLLLLVFFSLWHRSPAAPWGSSKVGSCFDMLIIAVIGRNRPGDCRVEREPQVAVSGMAGVP